MSGKHKHLVSDSESGEEAATPQKRDVRESSEDEARRLPPLPRKKRVLAAALSPTPTSSPVALSPSQVQASPPLPEKKKRRPAKLDLARVAAQPSELQWQRAMEGAVALFAGLEVDHDGLTMLPDKGTLECFTRAAQLWIAEQKIPLNFTYTAKSTFFGVIGKILFAATLKQAGIDMPGWNPTGLSVWRHQSEKDIHCLHGLLMLNKEQIIEMDVSSEAGQKALKEQPTKSKITTNRWGRKVVQLRNEDALVCVEDALASGSSCTAKSCGMSFTDGKKARVAFDQLAKFQAACYKNMTTAASHMIIASQCDCNYGFAAPPLLGRQVPRMSVFNVTNTDSIERDKVTDPKLLATLDHPAVFVFQCCNPVFRGSKTTLQKNCDYKLSSVDLVSAVQLAKQYWRQVHQGPLPAVFPEFKWSRTLQYQTALLPQGFEDQDDTLF